VNRVKAANQVAVNRVVVANPAAANRAANRAVNRVVNPAVVNRVVVRRATAAPEALVVATAVARSDGAAGSQSDGEGEGDSDSDGDSGGDCGDTGSLPGGVGGMGQDGECLGGGAAASESEAEASDGGGGGGGSEGGAEGQPAGAEGGPGGADGSVAGTGGAGGTGQFPAESSAERAERIGRELDESVGGFDEVLLEEQREIAAAGRNTEGFGEGSGSGGGISLGEQSAGSGGGVSVINTGQVRVSPTAGMTTEEIGERTPDDIPMSLDDDIIAKQLREAALAEEDPELRERLWEEYRKYTGI